MSGEWKESSIVPILKKE